MKTENPLNENEDLVEEVSNGQFVDRQKRIQLGYRTYIELSVGHSTIGSETWIVYAELTDVNNESNSRLSEGYTESRTFEKKKVAQKYFDYLVETHEGDDK